MTSSVANDMMSGLSNRSYSFEEEDDDLSVGRYPPKYISSPKSSYSNKSEKKKFIFDPSLIASSSSLQFQSSPLKQQQQQQKSDILYLNQNNRQQQSEEEAAPPPTAAIINGEGIETHIETYWNDEDNNNFSSPSSFHLPYHWPPLFDDTAAKKRNEFPSPLPTNPSDMLHQIQSTQSLQIRIITWNQQHVQESFTEHSPKELQVIQLLQSELIPLNTYHIIVLGTQECQTSITKSFFFKSKEWWENMCFKIVGNQYELIRGHSLQATHLVVFAHKALHSYISHVHSHAVPTGILDTIGNKGGIGISMKIYGSTFCFLTAHLAAHFEKMDKRTDEFLKISMEMSHVLSLKHTQHQSSTISKYQQEEDGQDQEVIALNGNPQLKMTSPSSRRRNTPIITNKKIYPEMMNTTTHTTTNKNNNMLTSTTIQYPEKKCLKCIPLFKVHPKGHKEEIHANTNTRPDHNPLMDEFDFVFWAGDFNYRIFGSRDVVDTLLDNNRHDLLWSQDQLFTLMQYDSIFTGFKEGPVHFRPSYKLNVESDVYDTSRKRRVPAWTDRILHKGDSFMKQISYSSASKIRLSDHRPVYASYTCYLLNGDEDSVSNLTQEEMGVLWTPQTKSEVCVIL